MSNDIQRCLGLNDSIKLDNQQHFLLSKFDKLIHSPRSPFVHEKMEALLPWTLCSPNIVLVYSLLSVVAGSICAFLCCLSATSKQSCGGFTTLPARKLAGPAVIPYQQSTFHFYLSAESVSVLCPDWRPLSSRGNLILCRDIAKLKTWLVTNPETIRDPRLQFCLTV